MITLKHHVNSIFNSVSYVLIDEETNSRIVIDVGDYDAIKKLLANSNLRAVLLTHVHYDHIYGLNRLLQDYPDVPIYTNGFGKQSLYDPWNNLSVYHDDEFIISKIENVKTLSDGETLVIDKKRIYVLETPGHDFSCLCFLVCSFLFTGDSYIPEERVFCKLQNGNKALAEQSLKRIMECTKSNNKILPGHNSNIQQIMEHNRLKNL